MFKKQLQSQKTFIADFFINWKKNWRPKSVFLAFTIKRQCEGKIIEKQIKRHSETEDQNFFDLEFEFSKDEKAFMKFKNQVGKFFVWIKVHGLRQKLVLNTKYSILSVFYSTEKGF